MEKKSIGIFICTLRKANGLTQQDLADRLHVSNKTVSRWERDESSPELALVPVIAELFGVTSDELLRGERIPSSDSALSAKSERQISYLIKSSMAKYQTHTLLSVFLSLTGFFLMLVLGYGVRAPVVGLGLAFVLIFASVLFQFSFLTRVRLSLGGVETSAPVAAPLYRSWSLFFGVCCLNIFVCTSIWPFIQRYQGIGEIISRYSWFLLLPLYLLLGLFICLVLSFLVPKFIARMERFGDAYACAQRRNARLRLLCSVLCFFALLGGYLVASLPSKDITDIAAGQTFESFEAFKEYAQTPVSVYDDGTIPEIYDPKTGQIRNYEAYDEQFWLETWLEDAAGNRYPYIDRNENISAIDFNDDMTSITVYSYADQIAHNRYFETRLLLRDLYYIGVLASAFIVYFIKRTRIEAVLSANP